MKGSNRWRALLIAVLALAAVLSVVANKSSSPFLGWLSFVAFLVAVTLYFQWRRTVHNERIKRNEARTRTDQ